MWIKQVLISILQQEPKSTVGGLCCIFFILEREHHTHSADILHSEPTFHYSSSIISHALKITMTGLNSVDWRKYLNLLS